MSEENVEMVRRIYAEGLIDRDPERLLDEFATPDTEFVNPPEAVEPGIRRGRVEVAQALRSAHESFDSWTLRERRIVRFEWGRDLEKALEAAGLRE